MPSTFVQPLTFVNVEEQVVQILRSTLNLPVARRLDGGTALLGHVAELDSMAVVSILTALEERFGIEIADDEIDGAVFATFGSLAGFVERMQAR